MAIFTCFVNFNNSQFKVYNVISFITIETIKSLCIVIDLLNLQIAYSVVRINI
jgi:hypothetical protein